MNDYELIVSSALRYGLGRMTYIVDVITDYIINDIDNLSSRCIDGMIRDIKEQERFGYGMDCDYQTWMKLLKALEETLNERSGV